jgi:hypothetical protein
MKKLSLIALLFLSPLQAISEDFVDDIIMQQNEQEALETTRGLFGSQQNKSSIASSELKDYVVKHVDRTLKSQVEALPLEVQKELTAAIQSIANALGKEAGKRKYNALSKEYVENVMQASLKKFFNNANSYVDQTNVEKRAEEFIHHHCKKAGLDIKPELGKLHTEFLTRKKSLMTRLTNVMESQQRTYLTKQEIEGIVHATFDNYIKRVQTHMKWLWVQSKIDDFNKIVPKDKALTYIPESGKTKMLHDHLKRCNANACCTNACDKQH